MGILRKAFAFLPVAGLAGLLTEPAAARSYPSRNITAIIPFAAGNANDVTARIVFEQLQVGVEPLVMSQPEFQKYFEADVRATDKLAKKAGIERQ